MQAPVGAPIQSENVGFPGSMQSQSSGKKSNKLIFIIIIIFLLFIGGITFLVFKSSRTTGEEPVPTEPGLSGPTSSPTSSPTPTPVAVNKSDVKIQVLNGTGVAGEAGVLQSALAALGYKKIDVGNASDTSATNTSVVFSSTLPADIVSEITTKLKAMYVSVDASSSGTGSTYDVKITTGPRKGQTTTTSATSTPAASTSPTATP